MMEQNGPGCCQCQTASRRFAPGEQRLAPQHGVDHSHHRARRNEQRLAGPHGHIPTRKGSRALSLACIDEKGVRCAIGKPPNVTRVNRLLNGTIAPMDGNSHCPNVRSNRTGHNRYAAGKPSGSEPCDGKDTYRKIAHVTIIVDCRVERFLGGRRA